MSGDALSSFHPAVAGWFRKRFGSPTEAQARTWPEAAAGRNVLLAAPTGSGKTLAAFLAAIDSLVREGLERGLADETYVVYVSPLKALSNDIQKNLQAPLQGIRDALLESGLPDVAIRDAVRTGDTPAVERDRMRKLAPHILVTTPESLFILMTSESGRAMLRRVRSVIVDELHALAGNKRGAHLMLTLERLEALRAAEGLPPLSRVGLSATVKPVEEMARYLVGQGPVAPAKAGAQRLDALDSGLRRNDVVIVDTGHVRKRDLGLELPPSPLQTVMSTEGWTEIYDRLAALVGEHRTTLIFVNQRKIAERVARHLGERIGEEHVTAHHGSLAKEHRLKAEQRLKAGQLKALVATSSLELGIDIGDVDLVCQLGSPRSIAAFLQRVGRAGHAVGATPKGRLFPLVLDDLLECAALFDAAKRGELDRIRVPEAPLDVLAQQIVAEASGQDWNEDELFEALRRAAPYAALKREDYDKVVAMLAEGYATRRGRRGAHLHHDAVNKLIRGRRGARLTAMTNGGVIPDQFDYDVVLMPEGHKVGSLNEDFSFESSPGDIFQLGNNSWRILKVETGRVFVEDAKGQPPTLPFWLGEAPGRTRELSAAVARINAGFEAASAQGEGAGRAWLEREIGLPEIAAYQLEQYLGASLTALGALPTLDTVIFERFFDEVGDTHLVVHSPFGSRVNRAWGLALRKRFCRTFNFELQASALEDTIVLSLGPSHSFPLEDVAKFLHPNSAHDVLVQALLDAPMFGTRWRWVASTALAVKRMLNGKRAPPQFQRSDSEDLLSVVFPDQLACAENLTGERQIPDHPLVKQAIHDCLNEVMDVDGFMELLRRLEAGEIRVICRDLAAPSPISHAILGARPYSFLDDGAAEERRTRMVSLHRLMDQETAAAIGHLDPKAIERLREELRPEPRDADELHDALVLHGFLTREEGKPWRAWFDELLSARRATVLRPALPRGEGEGTGEGPALWVPAERLAELRAALPDSECDPVIGAVRAAPPDPAEALREIVRSRLDLLGPVSAAALAAPMGLKPDDVMPALLALEGEGSVMRMASVPDIPAQAGTQDGATGLEWCERRLLHRLHRYTRETRRAAVRAVPPAQFMRFLFRWQGLAGAATDERREGSDGLLAVLRQLEGFSVAAGAWEYDVLSPRLRHYSPEYLDKLCAAGRIVWFRPSPSVSAGSGPVRSTPIVLCERDAQPYWQGSVPAPSQRGGEGPGEGPSGRASKVLEALRAHGASFFDDLVHDTGMVRAEVEQGLGELVSLGLVSSDSFAGLRALLVPAERREKLRRYRRALLDVSAAGRWTLPRRARVAEDAAALAEPAVEHVARALLRRYGVVFRALLAREDHLPPWRELFYVYRRMEARGEIQGGRFVTGFSGEQFALADAAAALRKAVTPEGAPPAEELVSISAADPLNLVGIVVPGDKVPALSGNRVLFRNGVPLAVQAGDEVRFLQAVEPKSEWEIRNLLIRRARPGAVAEPPGATH